MLKSFVVYFFLRTTTHNVVEHFEHLKSRSFRRIYFDSSRSFFRRLYISLFLLCMVAIAVVIVVALFVVGLLMSVLVAVFLSVPVVPVVAVVPGVVIAAECFAQKKIL